MSIITAMQCVWKRTQCCGKTIQFGGLRIVKYIVLSMRDEEGFEKGKWTASREEENAYICINKMSETRNFSVENDLLVMKR